MNIDALVKAIAYHETAYFEKGAGKLYNNGTGLMYWPNGVRKFIKFDTAEECLIATKNLILRKYMHMTIKQMSVIYSGNDNAAAWERNVTYYYGKFTK